MWYFRPGYHEKSYTQHGDKEGHPRTHIWQFIRALDWTTLYLPCCVIYYSIILIYHIFLNFRFLREKIQPVVTNEEQLIFACHLIGPTLTRFSVERPRCISDLTISLYEMLEQVSRAQTHLKHMDPISDLLYPFFKK